MKPGVYQGKKGIPLRIKAEVWEKINSEEQKTKTIGETQKSDTVKWNTEMEDKPIYETRAILDYQEWDYYDEEKDKQLGYRYKVAWKGYSDETWQNIQDLTASTGAIEEYWADADNGVKKWRKLRPASDNMAETLRGLTSSASMDKREIKLAGVQVHQAIGKDHEQVYRRLHAGEIKRTDVFTVILDVAIWSDLNNSEKKKMIKLGTSGKDTRKLYIPVRWTWNRLQKACNEKQKKYIQATLAEKAGIKKHMCWMSEHYATAEGLGADTANEVEIVVIPQMEMIACVRQATEGHTLRQEYVKRWSKGETISKHNPEVEKWIMQEEEIQGETTSIKQKGRMLCSNTPFQSHKMELKERVTSIKQRGRMLYSNTPFQSHKMELKERVTSIKQKGRMLYSNTPLRKYTRKDRFRAAEMHYTNYKHGVKELRMEDGLNVHMGQLGQKVIREDHTVS